MVRDQQWIVDMLQAAREILSFAEGFDRTALFTNLLAPWIRFLWINY